MCPSMTNLGPKPEPGILNIKRVAYTNALTPARGSGTPKASLTYGLPLGSDRGGSTPVRFRSTAPLPC